MAQTGHSAIRRAADALLRDSGTDLTSFIERKRDGGRSFQGIAKDLFTETAGVVDVTGETVRRWAPAEDSALEEAS